MSTYEAVERFLGTGEFDADFRAWDGDLHNRRAVGSATLRDVLGRVLRWKVRHAPLTSGPIPADAEARIRTRVTPLLTGLFPADRADVLVRVLPTRVVALTPASFFAHLDHLPLRTAWDLVNVLLDDLGAPPLADDVPEVDGRCAAGHAWVLPGALAGEEPFPDVVTHEVAHLLHTVCGAEVGLDGAEPLLTVPARHHETFAYACEVWTAAVRTGLEGVSERVARWRASSELVDARVDAGTLDALLDAALADPDRGWQVLAGWVEDGFPKPLVSKRGLR